MSEVKPTGGAWHVERYGEHLYVEAEGPIFICDTKIESAWERERGRIESDAALIAEAGTVYNETGRTPRQLADDVARFQNEVKRLRRVLHDVADSRPDNKMMNDDAPAMIAWILDACNKARRGAYPADTIPTATEARHA